MGFDMKLDIKKLLADEDITLRSYAHGKRYKTKCPKCSHRREGQADLEVGINPAGTFVEWKCSNCLWSDHIGDESLVTEQHVEPQTPRKFAPSEGPTIHEMAEFPDHVNKWFTDRGITPLTARTLGKVSWDAEIQALVIPYRELNTVVNVQHLTLEGHVTFEKNAKLVFYGVDATVAEKPLIITDGPLNALALRSAGMENILGVPQGAKASKSDEAFQYLSHAEGLLEASSKIILAVSNTEVGEALSAELARRIGIAKCFVLEMPESCTDMMSLVKTLGADVAHDVFNTAIPYPISGLYEVTDFEDSLLSFFEEGMCSGVSTGWASVDEYYTVMLGEVDVVTGIPNNGKSEWLDALMMNLAQKQEWKFAIFSPENSKEQHVTKLVEKRTQLPSEPHHPNRMSRETFLRSANWVSQHFVFIIGDDERNLPTLDWVLDRARSAILRYGIKGIVIDPWNELEHTRPQGMSETDYISLALSKIKRFARNHQVKVWIVAHPAKMYKDPKTGQHGVPSLYDISGSAHWANKVDNGIAVHRTPGAGNRTEIHVRKARQKHVGRKGTAYLIYDKDSGIFTDAPEGKQSDSSDQGDMPLEGDSDIIIIEPEK